MAKREKAEKKIEVKSNSEEKIDFARLAAFTKMGDVGVKVWICK